MSLSNVTPEPSEIGPSKTMTAGAVLSQVNPPLVISSQAPDPRVLRAVNPFIIGLLRSPLHGLLSRQMLVITMTGRHTGRKFSLPVGYVEEDASTLLVISQHSSQKRWWRNLRGGAPVVVRLRGRDLVAHAEALEERASVAAAIVHLIARLGPRQASARLYMGLDLTPPPTEEQLENALDGVVLVRIRLETGRARACGTSAQS